MSASASRLSRRPGPGTRGTIGPTHWREGPRGAAPCGFAPYGFAPRGFGRGGAAHEVAGATRGPAGVAGMGAVRGPGAKAPGRGS